MPAERAPPNTVTTPNIHAGKSHLHTVNHSTGSRHKRVPGARPAVRVMRTQGDIASEADEPIAANRQRVIGMFVRRLRRALPGSVQFEEFRST
jgi:hypothetical protein